MAQKIQWEIGEILRGMYTLLFPVGGHVQEPKLEDDDDDDDSDDDDENDEAGGDGKFDDNTFDGPGPTKARRQTFDGPVLPLDAESTFALPGSTITCNLCHIFTLSYRIQGYHFLCTTWKSE